MARINIEETWWNDPRKQHLARLLSSEIIATGAFFTATRLAQTYWLDSKRLIPEKIWKAFEFNAQLVEAGLAEIHEAGVYVVGSSDAFDWLWEKKKAGRKGGLAKSSRSKQTLAKSSKSKLRLPSSSSSISISDSNSKNTKGAEISKNDPASEAPPGGQASADADPCDPFADLKMPEVRQQQPLEKPSTRGGRSPDQRARIAKFVAAYVSAYEGKFGHRPEDLSDPKVRGQITAWAKDHPDVDRACELVQVFFQLDRKWFQVKGYDFLTFRNNLNAIGQALAQGSDSLSGGYSEAEIKRMTQGWGGA